ncbi:MAG: hypothetical protein EOP11_00830 [Proteobacteria bacterium]|nr:MAG: hypothetical protein EOP11_00830 [Pseudomonadota bacterium]
MEALEVLKPMKTCPDVLDCIAEDHESLRSVLQRLQSPELEPSRKKAIFKRFLPLYEAHTHAEEASIMEEGLTLDSLRPLILDSLEAHEVGDILLGRIKLAVDIEQWVARLNSFCAILEHRLDVAQEKTFPAMRSAFSAEQRELLGHRYLSARNHHHVLPTLQLAPRTSPLIYDEAGKVGYLFAWLLGVPAWILLLVFLVRG